MPATITQAVNAIHNQQCVVFPTETVYGLGANALCSDSVQQIFNLKQRPFQNPLIVHIASLDDIFSVTNSLSSIEQKLFETFSPGPLSLILPKKETISSVVTGGLDSVGVRIPNHSIALEFLSQVKVPICAPSANISGKPSPTTFEMAEFYMKNKGVVVLDGGQLDIGIESSVVKVDGNKIYLLRAGSITSDMIAECTGIVPEINISEQHRSPGTRFIHYKPKAQVIIFEFNEIPQLKENAALLQFNNKINPIFDTKVYNFTSIQEYAHHLYALFFLSDQQDISYIFCELPPSNSEGLALRDRLLKASGQ